jgi:hypothetical protein
MSMTVLQIAQHLGVDNSTVRRRQYKAYERGNTSMSHKLLATVLSPEAYEMILRWVDQDGFEPGNFGPWTLDPNPEWAGWYRADIYFPDGEPTGCWLRVQETNGCLSYGCYAADGRIQSWYSPQRVRTQHELDATRGLLIFHTDHGRIVTEH